MLVDPLETVRHAPGVSERHHTLVAVHIMISIPVGRAGRIESEATDIRELGHLDGQGFAGVKHLIPLGDRDSREPREHVVVGAEACFCARGLTAHGRKRDLKDVSIDFTDGPLE